MVTGVAWGKSKENGIWLYRPRATGRRYKTKVLWRDHDSLFIAWRRVRIRLMKPWRA